MNSNQLDETQTIYLKEFFSHYFHRKQHQQVMATISTGVTVLLDIIEQFQHKIGNKHQDIPPLFNKTTSIKQPHQEITENLEHIYNKLHFIFEHWQNPITASMSSPLREGKQIYCDQELYEMLNDYKKEAKQQRQLRQKIEQQCGQLQKTLQTLQSDKTRLRCEKKEMKAELSLVNSKLQEKKNEVKSLQQKHQKFLQEKQELQNKINELSELGVQLCEKDLLIEELTHNLQTSREEELRLQQKLKGVERMIKEKIMENEDRWKSVIEQKLTSDRLYKQPVCRLLREFVGRMGTTVINSSQQ